MQASEFIYKPHLVHNFLVLFLHSNNLRGHLVSCILPALFENLWSHALEETGTNRKELYPLHLALGQWFAILAAYENHLGPMNPYVDPYMNPYINPYVDPYTTSSQRLWLWILHFSPAHKESSSLLVLFLKRMCNIPPNPCGFISY